MKFYTHVDCLHHDPGAGHPESPARLEVILNALEGEQFSTIEKLEAPKATREQLLRVHSAEHVERIFQHASLNESIHLDADTVMSAGSLEAALHAAGAVCAAVDAVLAEKFMRAFCAVRPPGHHATHRQAMGFCLFNNIALGAAQALAVHKLQRIAIVDFDVHHGNGTQDIFWNEPRVLFASTHQSPLYPGTGTSDEIGSGNILNAPLPSAAGSEEFRAAFESIILPRLNQFQPQLVLISTGFDAHRLDPLANLNLETEDYAWVTRKLVEIADQHACGRIVSTLEGGYNLAALKESVTAHVEAMMGGIV